MTKTNDDVITLDRRTNQDRRTGDAEALDTGAMKRPRRKANRRRHIDPTTCERDYNDAEVEFMRAMDDYKQRAGRMFPTCSEVLEVLRDLGYRQLNEEQMEVCGFVDTEEADAEGEATADEEELEEAAV